MLFLAAWYFALPLSVSASCFSLCAARICLVCSLRTYPGSTIGRVAITSCVTPSVKRSRTSTGISTCYPSITPFGLTLGPGLPWADEPSPGTLGHSAEEFLPPLSLLMPAFALVYAPRSVTLPLRCEYNAPLPMYEVHVAASVHGLAPLHCRRRIS